jgi:NADPH-dependent glutamate synthase beta subunit-like oxidoreductase
VLLLAYTRAESPFPSLQPRYGSIAASMAGDPVSQYRVAVVGSGMAGLVTAYLLNQDPEHRYLVEVFEIVRPENGLFSNIDQSANALV